MIHILDLPTEKTVQYTTPDPRKAQDFLTRHPDVQDLLIEASRPLQDAFGKKATVSVFVATDPDITDGEFLVSSVQTSGSAANAQKRLDTFDDTWWLDNAPRAKGRLVFTVEFK